MQTERMEVKIVNHEVFALVLNEFIAAHSLTVDATGSVSLTQAQYESVMLRCARQLGIVSDGDSARAALVVDGAEPRVVIFKKIGKKRKTGPN